MEPLDWKPLADELRKQCNDALQAPNGLGKLEHINEVVKRVRPLCFEIEKEEEIPSRIKTHIKAFENVYEESLVGPIDDLPVDRVVGSIIEVVGWLFRKYEDVYVVPKFKDFSRAEKIWDDLIEELEIGAKQFVGRSKELKTIRRGKHFQSPAGFMVKPELASRQ